MASSKLDDLPGVKVPAGLDAALPAPGADAVGVGVGAADGAEALRGRHPDLKRGAEPLAFT